VNPATALAATLTDELVRCGVTEAVLAPGSRATPLALALDEASRAGRLRLHVRIDERSASFLALGLARASGRPVPVLCTSGSAAANFHPAVTEASESGVPLLLLTADRPPELRETSANQTIDQLKLYGSAVRWFCELGVPEERAGLAAYWRATVCRAIAYATGAEPGPVHLNIPFREPLIPDGDTTWPDDLAGRPNGAPWTATTAGGVPGAAAAEPMTSAGTDGSRTADAATAGSGAPWTATTSGGERPSAVPSGLPRTARGVLVVGDGIADPGPLVAHAHACGWPVISEPSGNARRGPNAVSAYHYVLATPEFADGHRPEVVVTAPKSPCVSSTEQWIVPWVGRWTSSRTGGSRAASACGIRAPRSLDSFQAIQALRVSSVSRSCSGKPCSFANFSALSPTSRTCLVRWRMQRATAAGCAMLRSPATPAPPWVGPCITEASSSTTPSSFGVPPRPTECSLGSASTIATPAIAASSGSAPWRTSSIAISTVFSQPLAITTGLRGPGFFSG